jgi:predicted nucleic acid-binding protein
MTEWTHVVPDTTVLSNYARTDSVEWLAARTPVPLTVDAVREELQAAREEGYAFVEAALAVLEPVNEAPEEPTDIIGVVPDGGRWNDRSGSLAALDRGETRALRRATPDEVLPTDDRDARDLARERNVPVTGSVGLLVDGVERGELSSERADNWLDTWQRYGYYSPVDSVDELLYGDHPPAHRLRSTTDFASRAACFQP